MSRVNKRILMLGLLIGAVLALPQAAQAQPFGVWMNFTPGYPTSHGYIEIHHSPALNPTGAFTFEAWVAVDNSASSEDCRSIAGKNYVQAWWIGLCTVGGQPTLRSYLKGGASQRNGGILPSGWNHIAVVFNGTQRLHYINGEVAASFPETGPLTTSTSPMRIGSDVSWPRTPTGSIDEVRLWNVARTTAQIRANLNVPLTSPQPGLVGVWSPGPAASVGPHNGSMQGTGIFPFTFPVALSCGSSTSGSLCLQDRFVVTIEWRTNPTPGTPTDGSGHTVPVANPGSGLFWFFSPDNWEVMVKVINGCALNDRWWVFGASATNLFYRMTVFDIRAGVQKIYFNYPGPPAPALTDTNAFATCP